ncbi:hypothetical protein VP1G_06724 [Cytospora mali]|uniref:Mtf2-like C-terminal domain-containing protein n=1 Tax=Cytospora mali TaxID=578113 RepID=A0A194V6G9_CYTMA|nr:hypothetical protein VP1G_06724 [Valsa mali var. pyri (nom. inval.)]
MSSTLTPFLYQTRTLYRLSTRAGYTIPTTYLARSLLHTTPHRNARRKDLNNDPIPFELPPELSYHLPDPAEEDAEPKYGTITPTEQQAFDRIFQEIVGRGAPPAALKTQAKEQKKQEKEGAEKSEGPSFLQALQQDANFDVNTIMQHAAEKYTHTEPGIRGLDPLSPLESTYSASEREKALLRFPASLRRAARYAFGAIESAQGVLVTTEGGKKEALGYEDGKQHEDNEDPVDAVQSKSRLAKTVELEAKRREERLKILSMMEEAKTDFEVWDIMEKEVFPLVEKLGIAEVPENPVPVAPKPVTKAKRGKRKKVEVEPEAEVQEAPAVPEPPKATLSMEIYGPIYPMLVLDGLRLLDTKFSRTSPFAFSLLPRIKQLGLASYVLGVSTSFYNRLMTIMWRRFGDANGVIALLEEMRHAGLYFDENTKSLVHGMEAVFSVHAARGDYGEFPKRLMNMPEFEPIVAMRLSHWSSQINRSIKEREGA